MRRLSPPEHSHCTTLRNSRLSQGYRFICRWPDYARHGYRWAFGALAYRTGTALVVPAATRDTAAWLRFLDSV